jgi:phosphatidate cytidylyltransferase
MAATNLTLRLVTAGVLIPIILALLFLGPAWGWLIFLLVVGVTGAVEFFGMTHPGDRLAQVFGVLLLWTVVLAMWFVQDHPMVLFTVVLLLPFTGVAYTLWKVGDIKTAALRATAATFGPFWLGAGFGSVAALRIIAGDDGPAYALLCLGIAWSSDTGGYFTGRALGKHKLYPAVSPKKTVEGAMGGVLAAVLWAVVGRYTFLPSLPLRDAVILGAVGAVLAVCGDLAESLIKRSTGVKDSGGILPGHGGMLDRVDAVMITAPLVMAYVIWVR